MSIPLEDQDRDWYWESPERDECESKGKFWVPGYYRDNGERVSGHCRAKPHENYTPTIRETVTGDRGVIKPERRGKLKGGFTITKYGKEKIESMSYYPDRASVVREKKRIEEGQ